MFKESLNDEIFGEKLLLIVHLTHDYNDLCALGNRHRSVVFLVNYAGNIHYVKATFDLIRLKDKLALTCLNKLLSNTDGFLSRVNHRLA